MDPLSLIACFSRNRVIGRDGKLPWHYPEDLAHFKRVTAGHTLILGRKTWESIVMPLEGRRVIVLSRNPHYRAPGCDTAASLDEAIALARVGDSCPFICGGGELYKHAIPHVTLMFLTEIQREVEGDTFFPEFNEKEWREVERRESGELVFRRLERKGGQRGISARIRDSSRVCGPFEPQNIEHRISNRRSVIPVDRARYSALDTSIFDIQYSTFVIQHAPRQPLFKRLWDKED